MGALPPVFIEFLGNATGFMATAKGVRTELSAVERQGGGSMAKLGGVSKAALLGIGAAAAVVAVKSVKMAADFQASMNNINTQAGVSKGKLKGLGDGVLALAGQVGFSPTSLSEALFHIESSFASIGITGPKAMELLKVSAEGAQVGHANLVDVTNALDAAVASGIPGVQNMSQAMGQLNAIVGSGDMQMQDLADAMGTGVLAVVKGYGLSLSDVGAALATFGDNNIRGAQAATDLRMSVQAMSVPAKSAGSYLKEFGMTTKTLSKDMQKGGLKLALNDLVDRMRKAGITSKEQGQVITQMFGKKAGSGLAVLADQADRLNSKYPELAKGAKGFGSAWETTQSNFNQQVSQLKSGFDALSVKLGTVLLPYAQKFLHWVTSSMGYIARHRQIVISLGAAVGGILVVGLAAATAAVLSFTWALLTNPLTWIVVGIMALVVGLVYLVTHWKQVWGYISGNFPRVARAFVAIWHWALKAFWASWNWAVKAVQVAAQWFDDNVVKWIMSVVGYLVKWWHNNSTEIAGVWRLMWTIIKNDVSAWWAWMTAIFTVVVAVLKTSWMGIWDTVKIVWAAVYGVVKTSIQLIMGIISVTMDVITGHWGKAWRDLKGLAATAFHNVISTIKNVASGLKTLLVDAGKNIIHGLIHGITSMSHAVGTTISSIGKNAVASFKSVLGIKSPSKVFEQLGIWINLGLVAGLTGSHKQVEAATKKTETLLMQARNRIAAMSGSGKNHKSSSWIKRHEAAVSNMEKYVKREGAVLDKLAKQREGVAAKLKAAQAHLASLQKAWTSERNSIASSILQGASVVMQSSENGMSLSAGDVVANLQDQMAQAQAFAANLQKLKKMGLSTDLLNQIASAGVSQGGDTASALTQASSSQIAQMNSMQKSLTTAANTTGGVVADAMYGAGINSAKGLIKGLQSQEKAIEKQMMKIAKSMEKAIKRALGIHSPSRLFHEIGQFVSQGLANGIDAGSSLAGAAANRLAGVVTSSATPSLSLAGGGSGGAVHNHVHIEVHGSVRSDRDLRDIFQQEILKLNGRNSSNGLTFKR